MIINWNGNTCTEGEQVDNMKSTISCIKHESGMVN